MTLTDQPPLAINLGSIEKYTFCCPKTFSICKQKTKQNKQAKKRKPNRYFQAWRTPHRIRSGKMWLRASQTQPSPYLWVWAQSAERRHPSSTGPSNIQTPLDPGPNSCWERLLKMRKQIKPREASTKERGLASKYPRQTNTARPIQACEPACHLSYDCGKVEL